MVGAAPEAVVTEGVPLEEGSGLLPGVTVDIAGLVGVEVEENGSPGNVNSKAGVEGAISVRVVGALVGAN